MLAILANIALEGLKSFLAPIMENYESDVVATYSQKIESGDIKVEEFTISSGDTIDGIIYNYIDRSNTDKNLEAIRYDISKINTVKGVDLSVLYPGDVIYLPVY